MSAASQVYRLELTADEARALSALGMAGALQMRDVMQWNTSQRLAIKALADRRLGDTNMRPTFRAVALKMVALMRAVEGS